MKKRQSSLTNIPARRLDSKLFNGAFNLGILDRRKDYVGAISTSRSQVPVPAVANNLVLEVVPVHDGDGGFTTEALSFDGLRHCGLVEVQKNM